MIKAIAFDLQFTLVYLEDFTLTKWFQLFDEGFLKVIDYLKELNLNFDEKKLIRTLKRIRNRYFARIVTEEQQYFTEQILQDTFSKNNINLNWEDLTKCYKLYHSVEIAAWKPRQNLNETLQTLSKNYKLAIITNASKLVADEILELQNIKKYFDLSLSDARKPQLDSFIKFKEIMKANFEELVMVGDDVQTDINSSQKLGMKTVHLYRGYEYLLHHAILNIKADKKISKIEDLINIIQDF